MNRLAIQVVALVSVVIGVAAQQQTPPAAGQTTVISGVLTSADLGMPVRKAQVRLIRGSKTVSTTTTDADGRYVFTAIPAGDYTVSASRPGFLDMVRGARRPGLTSQGVVVTVVAGQKRDDISWTMARAGVITGTVLDEYGDPAFNVPVRALRYIYENGHRSLTSGGNAVSDDRGAYRVAGLMPGEYLVAAVPRDGVAQSAAQADAIRDRQAQIAAAAKATGKPQPAPLPPPPPPSPTGYVPIYFPGTPMGGSSAPVRVGISEEVGGIDIRLQLVETITVSGRLTSTEAVLPTTRLQLIDTSMPMSTVGIWFRDARSDGTFAFPGVVPGSYILKGHGTPGGPTGSAGGEMWGSVNVSVDARGASEITLPMQRGVTISGRFVLDNLPAGFDRARIRARLYPVSGPSDWEMPILNLNLAADGRFAVANVLPGQYRFTLTDLPDGWALGSASFGGKDAADYHLTVDGSRDLTGEITLISSTSEVAGVVADSSGTPATEHTVMIFPAERAMWLPQSRRIHLTRAGANGRYAFRGLPPGDYRIVTVLDPEAGRHFDPEYLAQLAAISAGVTLEAGATRTMDLTAR